VKLDDRPAANVLESADDIGKRALASCTAMTDGTRARTADVAEVSGRSRTSGDATVEVLEDAAEPFPTSDHTDDQV